MKFCYNVLVLTLIVCATFASCCGSSDRAEVSSPDGRIDLQVRLQDGRLYYAVGKDAQPILLESGLGFELRDAEPLLNSFEIEGFERGTFDQTWEQVWGESQFVRNHYNELRVRLRESTPDARRLDVVFRVFDDGFGFRYEFPEQPNLGEFAIMREATEFRFARVHNAWWLPANEPYYESYGRHTPINEMDTVHTPLTLEGADGRFYALHEANLTDYAKMNLVVTDSVTLNAELVPWSDGVKVYAQTPCVTPWRTMIVGEKVGDLIESPLMLNLNDPCKIEDTSWIRPGKYIGIWWAMHMGDYTWYYGPKHGATTAMTKRYLDFAADNGFVGVLVEGWNEGWDGNWMKNSDQISFTKAYPDFDLQAITDYAASKGVELIGHHETAANSKNYEAQMEAAYALYQKHGVHRVKTGNVNLLMDGREAHDGQYAVRHMRKVVETAARYQICIDEHEPVIPTGVGRTWPNLMTHEAVRGQEHDAWSPDGGSIPEHTVVVPFLRGLAGPTDFTFGTFCFENKAYPGTRVQTTIAKQLALYVVIYSPLQMASDTPENYAGVKAFDFIRDVPVDWAQTRVLDAVIGDYTIVARRDRNSEDWYLGAITDEQARDLRAELSFLEPGASYTAQIYADGPGAEWKTNPTSVGYREVPVDASQTLDLHLATSGGCAIRFVKN